MQAGDRLEDNWALRFATLEADRLGKPLIIHHGLGPSDPLSNDRSHTFILEGAAELAARAADAGYHYQCWLRPTPDDPGGAIDALAARAALIVTDDLPTAGVNARTARVAERVPCRVVRVESWCIVPAATFAKSEYAARTIRPKLAKLRDLSLTPVDDRPPRKSVSAALARSIDLPLLDVANADIPATVARCAIDHAVPASHIAGGYSHAAERLDAFVADGLRGYDERRKEPSDDDGSSRLSPYLHYGHIAAAEVARAVLRAGPKAQAEAFLDEMLTWRELAFNFCTHDRHYDKLRSLPDWVVASMRKHTHDTRETTYTLAQLEAGETHDALWNAGQRELAATGVMHNAVRMLWGKSVLLWTNTYATALRHLLHLNNKYALDGFDPNSYANILWCFGKFDRPFAERPVWGTIRPMSLARAREKFDADAYIARWT